MVMVAAFVAGNCSEVRSVHVVLGLCDAKLGVRSVRVVLSLRCGCSCVWSGGVGHVVRLGVSRAVLGVLGVETFGSVECVLVVCGCL